MAIKTITIDLAYENDISDLHKEFAKTNIKLNILQEVGPAGGWPEVELTGEEDDLRAWFLENYADSDDIEFYMGNED
jgi:hypothetical protein